MIEGFGISNYRSFDEKGVILNDLKKINIIIGKNNSGKSNILRFLQTLHKYLNNLDGFPFDIQNQHRRNGKKTSIYIRIKGEDLPINKSKALTFSVPITDDFYKTNHFFEYQIKDEKIVLPKILEELDSNQLIPFQSHYSSADRNTIIKTIQSNWNDFFNRKIRNNFNDLIYIPHLRVIQEGHSLGDSNSSINGSNIISKMFEMQNPDIGHEDSKKKFNLIRAFVRELINKPNLEIEIPHTKKEIVLTIDENRLPLESFGTGIHQLVLLCSTLVIHENSIVCIEEPEIHLHPELQRKFIKFLCKTKNKYFITTHSNIFLDHDADISVYHVKNDGVKSTITNSKRTKQTFSILRDLGYQSSDILQSNGIIWVEGPSDRIYLLKWINIVSPDLIEGIHFSIMFYGGRLLSNLSFENEKIISELIPLLKLNMNAFIIMDRDGFKNNARINQTKTRIKTEIGSQNCWITNGREIENYLSENTLKKWLSIERITTDPNKKLETIISKSTKKKYNLEKNKFSKEICKHITKEDFEVLDLKSKINQLVKRIDSWN